MRSNIVIFLDLRTEANPSGCKRRSYNLEGGDKNCMPNFGSEAVSWKTEKEKRDNLKQ